MKRQNEQYIVWTPAMERAERKNNIITGAAVFGGILFLLSAESIIEYVFTMLGI